VPEVSRDVAAEPSSRRAQAVARTADPARQRAEERVEAFLDAARVLISSSDDGKDFTIQEVIDRSGQSLRSFYQHFAGKHELLLALFEEAMRSTTEQLAEVIDQVDEPPERLRCFGVEYHRLCLLGTARYADNPLRTRAMAQFAQQLLIYHPEEATQAFAPLVTIVRELLDDAARSGAIRSDLDADTAGFLLQAVMFHAFVPTIAGTPPPVDPVQSAERLWQLLLRSLSPDGEA
jgi:AcrR family transcriptional regulator